MQVLLFWQKHIDRFCEPLCSLVPYGFDLDTMDQSTKFCTVIPLDILTNFRRGATFKSPGTP